jgi:5-oxoprolinase (ATP-hydrolysing) subunit B
MTPYPRFIPAGDMGLVVELGDDLSLRTNARVRALDRLVTAASIVGVIEILPTNRSLFVTYEPLVVTARDLERALRALVREIPDAPEEPAGRSWLIPTVYGGDFGIDLAPVATSLGFSESELVARHAAQDYRVFMIGFQPGFAYLGALDPSLGVSRRDVPRPVIPAGTVSIAGAQTVINSVAAPSGWNLIGRTPVRLFNPDRSPPFLLAAGDLVRFKPVPAEAWAALDTSAASGEIVAEALA